MLLQVSRKLGLKGVKSPQRVLSVFTFIETSRHLNFTLKNFASHLRYTISPTASLLHTFSSISSCTIAIVGKFTYFWSHIFTVCQLTVKVTTLQYKKNPMEINNLHIDFLFKLPRIVNWDLTLGTVQSSFPQSRNRMLTPWLSKSVPCISFKNTGLSLLNFFSGCSCLKIAWDIYKAFNKCLWKDEWEENKLKGLFLIFIWWDCSTSV